MSELFGSVLEMSLWASIAAVIVIIVRLCLKNQPKVFSYMLWSIVFFRLLCPLSISVPVTVHTPHNISDKAAQADAFEIPETDTKETTAENMIIPSISETHVAYEKEKRPDYLTLLSANWLIGLSFVALWGIYSYIALKRHINTALPIQRGIYESDRISNAFVFGVIYPKIYIPSGLHKKQKELIISHEKAHLRRFDHLIKLTAYITLMIHWFNPLIWLCFELMCRDMEQSCDETVIGKLDRHSTAEYCEALITLNVRRSYPAPTFSENNTKKRIANIVNYKKPKFAVLTVITVLCTIFFCACSIDITIDDKNTEHIESDVSIISIDEKYSHLVSSEAPLYIEIEDGTAIVRYCMRSYIGTLYIPGDYNGVPVMTIGESAFCGCSGIDTVLIPDTVTRIREYAFADCTNLSNVTFPETLIKIDDSAFSGCASITSVTMPEKLRYVGAHAFENCVRLQSVKVSGGITSLEEGTFSGCSMLRNIDLGNSITSIGAYCFSGCKSLYEIEFPLTLCKLYDRAFYKCSNLKEANGIDYIGYFGAEVFDGCPFDFEQ